MDNFIVFIRGIGALTAILCTLFISYPLRSSVKATFLTLLSCGWGCESHSRLSFSDSADSSRDANFVPDTEEDLLYQSEAGRVNSDASTSSRTTSRAAVFFCLLSSIAISDSVVGLVTVILEGSLDSPKKCSVAGGLASSFLLLSSLLMACLAMETKLMIYGKGWGANFRDPYKRLQMYLYPSICIVLGVDVVVLLATPGFGSDQENPSYCHLKDPTIIPEILLFYLWIWLSFIIITACNVANISRIVRRGGKRELRVVLKLAIYPILYMLCWLPSTIHRILSFCGVNDLPAWFIKFYVTLSFLSGINNAICFGLSNTIVRDEIRRLVKKARRLLVCNCRT